MSEKSRELMKTFGKLMQNRAFLMSVGHQPGMGGHGGTGGARGQMRLLHLLHQAKNGLTNADIAEMLDIRPSSVSATISKLEDAGLAERVPSETDKRAVIVKLTAQGQQMFDQYDERVDDWSEKLFGGLTEGEQEQLGDLLTKVTHHVGDLNMNDFMPTRHDWPHRGMGNMGHMDRPHW
ncbi:MarR family winged helix-turn-helix transcriptional regulator [Levilactobacillus cerevisiae]|uniref:MarR family winged helix-turn-helix transcriptional regulator n=1 Tax=Levilactobacillus cerevisiae TaxID=1704076 RepID=UPI000F7998B5|nr:MarR family transcriptional regulator [Levilactobacillus cerevisiae]